MEEMLPHALQGKDRAEKSCQFKGIRFQKWGSWVAEVRMPRSRHKLWLGSYKTAERAARAYDAALYCLRGANAIFNFPDSVPSSPSASSLSHHQIKLAAARYVHIDHISISPSARNNDENGSANKKKKAVARKDSVSPSRPVSAQETMPLSNGLHPQEEDELALLWESVTHNLEQLPSIEEAWPLNLIPSPIPSWEEQQHEQYEKDDINNYIQLTDLWNFRDV